MIDAPKIALRGTRQRETLPVAEFQITDKDLPKTVDARIAKYRMEAWKIFEKLPYPSIKDEAWRRTDLRGIDFSRLMLPGHSPKQLDDLPRNFLESITAESPAGQIISYPDRSIISLDEELKKKGVLFTDWATAERDYPDLLMKYLGTVVHPEEGKFSALASAMATVGIFLFVPAGVKVAAPIHSILWGDGRQTANFSHLLVVLDEGASVTFVHESASSDQDNVPGFHDGIVEIKLDAGADLKFVELQSWGKNIYNINNERVILNRDSNIDWISGALGSKLTKNFSDIDLIGQGSSAKISGFYFADGDQHFDHDSQQNHMAPNTTSDLLFKGAVKDHSRSIWQGMIHVDPVAQKTDGYQANRNLILSPDARADSIPGLEILANDVRCSHGATVGKIDPEQIFYLKSRGIHQNEAVQLIVEGFFEPIMQRIPFEAVRRRFQKAIHQKIGSEI